MREVIFISCDFNMMTDWMNAELCLKGIASFAKSVLKTVSKGCCGTNAAQVIEADR